jgi:hypothetical protein
MAGAAAGTLREQEVLASTESDGLNFGEMTPTVRA